MVELCLSNAISSTMCGDLYCARFPEVPCIMQKILREQVLLGCRLTGVVELGSVGDDSGIMNDAKLIRTRTQVSNKTLAKGLITEQSRTRKQSSEEFAGTREFLE
jgi:hypothetical protein